MTFRQSFVRGRETTRTTCWLSWPTSSLQKRYETGNSANFANLTNVFRRSVDFEDSMPPCELNTSRPPFFIGRIVRGGSSIFHSCANDSNVAHHCLASMLRINVAHQCCASMLRINVAQTFGPLKNRKWTGFRQCCSSNSHSCASF